MHRENYANLNLIVPYYIGYVLISLNLLTRLRAIGFLSLRIAHCITHSARAVDLSHTSRVAKALMRRFVQASHLCDCWETSH